MDGAIDSATAQERGVGGVDDGVDGELSYVVEGDLKGHGLGSAEIDAGLGRGKIYLSFIFYLQLRS